MTDGHCFISYSNGDADEFGPQLAIELEGGNPFIETWYDKRDIPAGATWDEKVPEAIKTCKCFIFVMTNDSIAENTICADEWDLALRYKRPILIIRLDKDIKEAPFRLGKRQWIDFVGNPKAGMAKLRLAIQRLESPEGQLDLLRDRLADANRDLIRIQEQDEKSRIESEISDLSEEIKAAEFIKKDPEKAKKQTRKNINTGLERDRQPINFFDGEATSKFINPRPGSIPDYFEGRITETQEMADFLRNGHQRIMTIIGRAGSGKTVLTCRTLKQLESGEFPNELGKFKVSGIVYLSEIGNYKISVPNIFSGLLNLINSEEARKIDEIYRESKKPIDEKIYLLLAALPSETTILLLDNFENLLDNEHENLIDQELHTTLTAILQAETHKLKVVITTRVLPRQLSMTEPAKQYIKHLEEGLPSPFAENVLRKMDRDGQAGLRDASNELLSRIRESTLGYPRALEALYAILRVDRYSNIEELIEEGLPETVVEKFVGEAYSRLDLVKQKIIQTLAVYNRPVSSAAVDYALQFHIPGINSVSALERLVSMHFVRRESKKYFLHPADQNYALSRMPLGNANKRIGQGARARTWEQNSLTLRAADYFVQARKPRTEWKNLDDLAPLLAEFELRISANDYNGAAKALTEFDSDYLLLWGHYRLTIDLHNKVLEKVDNPNVKHSVYWTLGLAYSDISDYKNALFYSEKVLTEAREKKDKINEGSSLVNIGNIYLDMGKIDEAIKMYEKGLSISTEINYLQTKGNALSNLGKCHLVLGNLDKALSLFKQGLAIQRKVNDKKNMSVTMTNIGVSYFELNDHASAIEYLKQAIEISDAISFLSIQQGARYELVEIYLSKNDLKSSESEFESMVRLNPQEMRLSARENLLQGIIALRQNHIDTAIQAFKDAVQEISESLEEVRFNILYTKGLALCGLAICEDKKYILDAIEVFKKAKEITPYTRTIKENLQLLNEITKCDKDDILKDVRDAIEGKDI